MIPIYENLRGRTAAITGGSGVLSSAMARELARHGVSVAILNRSTESGAKVAQEIVDSGGIAKAFTCDVTKAESICAAKKEIDEEFGRCEILINGAGGNVAEAITTDETFKDGANSNDRSFFDLEIAAFSKVFDLNLTGTIATSQIFAKDMIGLPGATIVNISSMSAFSPLTKVPAYSASKAGINNFTSWLAVYLAKSQVRVNAIAPGFFLTTQNRHLLTNEDGSLTARSKKIIDKTPMARFGEPHELLGTLLWLLDEELSGFITGVTIPVDGGFMANSGV